MLTIDYRDRRPIYEQLVTRVEELCTLGLLKEGEQLPSVRALATELSINPNTIQRAYAELDRLGVTVSIKGRGSFIAPDLTAVRMQKKDSYFEQMKQAVDHLIRCGALPAEITQRCGFYIQQAAGKKV